MKRNHVAPKPAEAEQRIPKVELGADHKVALLELAVRGLPNFPAHADEEVIEPVLLLVQSLAKDVEALLDAAPKAMPAAA